MHIYISQCDADPDPHPDPSFQADADLDPNHFPRVRHFFLQIFNYFFQILPKLVMCNFLRKNAGGRVRDKG